MLMILLKVGRRNYYLLKKYCKGSYIASISETQLATKAVKKLFREYLQYARSDLVTEKRAPLIILGLQTLIFNICAIALYFLSKSKEKRFHLLSSALAVSQDALIIILQEQI